MKNAKLQGKMSNVVKIGSMVSLDTETVSSTGKVEKASYVVTCTRTSDTYQVAKFDGQKQVEEYITDTWNGVCTCDGWRNGYLCRHLRMVSKLISEKVL